jgi:hypothetical protein
MFKPNAAGICQRFVPLTQEEEKILAANAPPENVNRPNLLDG